MDPPEPGPDLTPRLVEQFYTEAMLLADEARTYFDEQGRGDRDGLAAVERVRFACESMKVTTRLMHVVAWLLTRKALHSGELEESETREPGRRLGEVAPSEADDLAALPLRARLLVSQSQDLYTRVARLDEESAREGVTASPARSLQGRLQRSF